MQGRDVNKRSFDEFFRAATKQLPFGFQADFARDLPALVDVPTGLGKTAMAVVGWLWRRRGGDDAIRQQTPRRLVYCLPMRVLVEQTRDNAVLWLHDLKLLAGTAEFNEWNGKKSLRSYTPHLDDPTKVAVHVLMGGEDEEDWDIHPEREAIIIGTQDMLLSRALNRGYAASRARWPMQFGLLHNDCLWVFDEIQLMGSGLATTAQLAAFRRKLPSKDTAAKNSHGCRSVWMSATMQRDWLKTVDFKDHVDGLTHLKLSEDDHKNDEVEKRWIAPKPLTRVDAPMNDVSTLANKVRQAHKLGTRTIVVVNTVKRACGLFDALEKPTDAGKGTKVKKTEPQDSTEAAHTNPPKLVLLHSRFRPDDRERAIEAALADPPSEGTIIVSTQVIEAGVDVSATTLFTELAPWASLVQRFGRCNRRGEENEHASVRWIDLPNSKPEDVAKPYKLVDLQNAAEQLKPLTDVGLRSLPNVELPFEHTHVIRKKDLIDLFDTTPDLAGNDIDIDRYVREIVDETDVRVFWRDYGDPSKGATPNKINGEDTADGESSVAPAPLRDELCPVPIGSDKNPGFRQFAKKHDGKVWRWSFIDKTWEKADAVKIVPGQVYLIHAGVGGYSSQRGWTGDSKDKPTLEYAPKRDEEKPPDANEGDRDSQIGVWQTIAEHTDDVCNELDTILKGLVLVDRESGGLRDAARWHDLGKAHAVFQSGLPDGCPDTTKLWAKAPGRWKRYTRRLDNGSEIRMRHFRHELASAMAVLQKDVPLTNADRDVVAYLIAAHHGKVRLSIRSFPDEKRPRVESGITQPLKRFARGVWDGDVLPATDLGGGVNAPTVTLSLEPMELGLCESPPFASEPSWIERVLRLLDDIGPFRLAYLEAILRAADERASAAAKGKGADHA